MRILALSGFLVLSGVASANLVTNGGFETNTWGGTSYYLANAGDTSITSWAVSQNSVDIVGTDYSPYDGSFAVDLAGTPGPGTISQSVGGTSAGSYAVSFWGRKSSGNTGTDGEVTVDFGSSSATVALTDTWTQYSFTMTGDLGSTTLSLATNPTNTSFGNLFVDNVSVEAVPE
ncbi:DUF642 domain-containing protein, partial [bacterium]